MNPIVVGVDGTESSQPALRFALEEARVRATEVVAVHAWQPAMLAVGAGAGGWAVPDASAIESAVEAARTAGERALADASAQAEASGVPLTTRLIESGSIGEALCDAAKDAAMLVVGTHGHRAIVELVLGSVSHHCVLHAPCPVVTVRCAKKQPPVA